MTILEDYCMALDPWHLQICNSGFYQVSELWPMGLLLCFYLRLTGIIFTMIKQPRIISKELTHGLKCTRTILINLQENIRSETILKAALILHLAYFCYLYKYT